MKFVSFLMVCMITGAAAFAQNDFTKEAIVHSSTTFTSIEDEEEALARVQADGNERMRMFRNMMEGETKGTTYIKDAWVKTDFRSETTRGSLIRDNDKKMTTTLMQMMGRKTGFYVTDQDQEDLKKRMDSMMQERAKEDTAMAKRLERPRRENNKSVVETQETKKIAGYNCKKAYIVTTNFLGQKDSMEVWFTPDIKFEHIHSVGGTSGMGGMMMRGGSNNNDSNGFELLDGFVMQYQTKMGRNFLMDVVVTKIETGKKIEDKTFEIPKGYDVKPLSEMQSTFGGPRGGMQIRVN